MRTSENNSRPFPSAARAPIIEDTFDPFRLHHWRLICQATTIYVSTEELACSKSATPKHIFGVALSQLLRQWRSWRTGSAAYAAVVPIHFTHRRIDGHSFEGAACSRSSFRRRRPPVLYCWCQWHVASCQLVRSFAAVNPRLSFARHLQLRTNAPQRIRRLITTHDRNMFSSPLHAPLLLSVRPFASSIACSRLSLPLLISFSYAYIYRI